ncbi:MAG: monofunctional biosynthetic peptidoglycan transglycosylase [Cytophagaceae bacterium]|nr:monofunctional biosynthetic peptidoglycan transglycosylase [Cytophagaceae bacterium]
MNRDKTLHEELQNIYVWLVVLKEVINFTKIHHTLKEQAKEFAQSALRIIKKIAAVFLTVSILSVVLLRFINPPFTWLMLIRAAEQWHDGRSVRIQKKWKDLKDISPHIPLAFIAAEDQRFTEHFGFDFESIENAYENNNKPNRKRILGASTISQQTAKNLFLWPQRSWFRKALEVYFTLLIELLWSKERILEVYVNIVETGDGYYGVEAASLKYFNRSADKVSRQQAALLAAALPNPLKRNPKNPSKELLQRQKEILKQMDNIGKISLQMYP